MSPLHVQQPGAQTPSIILPQPSSSQVVEDVVVELMLNVLRCHLTY